MLLSLLLPLALATPGQGPDDAQFLRWVKRQIPPTPHPVRAEGYDFAAGLFHRVAELEREWPGHVAITKLDKSVDGRPLWAFSVQDPGTPVRQRVLVYAQLHALEWIGAEVAVALLEEVVPHPPPGVELVVVPLVNPDGRYFSEQDLLNDRVRSYRRANSNGVDLNRDWSVNRDADNLWARLPFTRRYYYSSPEPLSQPETRALDRLAATGFDVTVSLHAYGGYIYAPWAGLWARTPDHAQLMALGQVMAEGQPNHPYRVMQLSRWIFFFRALGTELDHMYAVHGAQSYLIELTHSGIRPLKPSTWRDYFRWYNPEDKTPHVEDGVGALMALLRYLSAGEDLGAASNSSGT
ncbi:MAG: hypothetical protein H6741_02005 [Alphaproteobacteria bacterium]|nr:hypothetical protein [Alphaproteobacteria bacterium]MCB9791477.1 hypothetical protein [Alphaproteobacteria bacterium]